MQGWAPQESGDSGKGAGVAGMWGSKPRFPGASEGNLSHPGPQHSAKTECPPTYPEPTHVSCITPNSRGLLSS